MMVTLTLVLTFGRISDLHALDRVRVLDDNRGVLGRTRIQGHSLEFSLPLRARTHQGGESLRHRVRLKDGQEMMHANCRGRDGSRGRGGRSPTGGLHRSHSTVPLLSDMTRFRTAGEILVPHTFRVQVDLIVRITIVLQPPAGRGNDPERDGGERVSVVPAGAALVTVLGVGGILGRGRGEIAQLHRVYSGS